MLRLGAESMSGKQIKVIFLVDDFVFKTIESAKKFIADSDFESAEKYLQKAVTLLPSDPIVNDHFADILWINNKKIQARYYWNYVLSLKETEIDMKKEINKKIISGLDVSIIN